MSARGARRFAVFGNGDFGLYLVARFLGTLAVQMQTVAVGWQVYEVTRDPLLPNHSALDELTAQTFVVIKSLPGTSKDETSPVAWMRARLADKQAHTFRLAIVVAPGVEIAIAPALDLVLAP